MSKNGVTTLHMCTIPFMPSSVMENPSIVNLMRNMKADCIIPLEEVFLPYPEDTKLYRGRQEMLIMKMLNGRNIQMFRGGKVQILGRVSDAEAENMRLELITKLKRINSMQQLQVTKMTVSNLVISVQLKTAICLQKIKSTDANFFHEIELFPAALIRKWHPVHVAIFHTGKIIVTGLKSIEQFYDIMSTLISFLQSSHMLSKK